MTVNYTMNTSIIRYPMRTEKGEIKMKHLKKIVSVILLLCLVAGSVAAAEPEKAKAGFSTWDGQVDVYNLDNDYKDGKYRIWEKVVYTKDAYSKNNGIGLTVSNQYVSSSSGKKVATWKSCEILRNGGTQKLCYGVAFSKLPSDTYTLHFSVTSNYNHKSVNYTRKVVHSAGKVSYKSSKYEYDTNGEKYLKVYFSIQQLKGYTPTFEVYNSQGKRIYSKTNNAAVKYADCSYWFTWNFKNSSGNTVPAGTYTFKVSVNGKSGSKNLTVK